MYFRNVPRHARGFAAYVLRDLGDRAGHRERAILADPQVHAVRWDGGSDCVEFTVPDRKELGTCVVRRSDRTIVG